MTEIIMGTQVQYIHRRQQILDNNNIMIILQIPLTVQDILHNTTINKHNLKIHGLVIHMNWNVHRHLIHKVTVATVVIIKQKTLKTIYHKRTLINIIRIEKIDDFFFKYIYRNFLYILI